MTLTVCFVCVVCARCVLCVLLCEQVATDFAKKQAAEEAQRAEEAKQAEKQAVRDKKMKDRTETLSRHHIASYAQETNRGRERLKRGKVARNTATTISRPGLEAGKTERLRSYPTKSTTRGHNGHTGRGDWDRASDPSHGGDLLPRMPHSPLPQRSALSANGHRALTHGPASPNRNQVSPGESNELRAERDMLFPPISPSPRSMSPLPVPYLPNPNKQNRFDFNG